MKIRRLNLLKKKKSKKENVKCTKEESAWIYLTKGKKPTSPQTCISSYFVIFLKYIFTEVELTSVNPDDVLVVCVVLVSPGKLLILSSLIEKPFVKLESPLKRNILVYRSGSILP